MWYNHHFVILVDSMRQGFRWSTTEMVCLCSVMLGGSAGKTWGVGRWLMCANNWRYLHSHLTLGLDELKPRLRGAVNCSNHTWPLQVVQAQYGGLWVSRQQLLGFLWPHLESHMSHSSVLYYLNLQDSKEENTEPMSQWKGGKKFTDFTFTLHKQTLKESQDSNTGFETPDFVLLTIPTPAM